MQPRILRKKKARSHEPLQDPVRNEFIVPRSTTRWRTQAEEVKRTGQVKDQAEIARTAGITRARVTQIINLTQLAPDIQEAILNLERTTDHVPRFREREVRTIAILPNWEKQRVLWKRLSKWPKPSLTTTHHEGTVSVTNE